MMTNGRSLAAAVAFGLVFLLNQGAVAAQSEPGHPNPPALCRTLSGHYAFRWCRPRASPPTAADDPAGLAGAPQQDILRVGVFTLKNDCSVSGRTIATTDDNAGVTKIIDFKWAGLVTAVSPDGTGRLSVNPTDTEAINSCVDGSGNPIDQVITPCGALEGPERYAFVSSTSTAGRAWS